MHLLWAGLILGIAAVWGVPIVTSILKSVLPVNAQAYLPSATIPTLNVQAVVMALIYGILLGGVLIALSYIGLRTRRG